MTAVILTRDIPVLLTPTGSHMIVENIMKTNDDSLLVSLHGDIAQPWLSVKPNNFVKFSEPTYVMQSSWDSREFPVADVLA